MAPPSYRTALPPCVKDINNRKRSQTKKENVMSLAFAKEAKKWFALYKTVSGQREDVKVIYATQENAEATLLVLNQNPETPVELSMTKGYSTKDGLEFAAQGVADPTPVVNPTTPIEPPQPDTGFKFSQFTRTRHENFILIIHEGIPCFVSAVDAIPVSFHVHDDIIEAFTRIEDNNLSLYIALTGQHILHSSSPIQENARDLCNKEWYTELCMEAEKSLTENGVSPAFRRVP